MNAIQRLVGAWRTRKTARPWRSGTPPLLRFVVLIQRRSDSKWADWEPWQTSTLDETVLSKAGANLHGIYLDVSALSRTDQIELGTLLNRKSGHEDIAREQELLLRCPRVGQVPGGYDIDFDDPADSAAMAELVRVEEARRGITLREAWSGGEKRGKRHLEWGSVDPHPNAMRGAFGRALDVAKAIGLVPKRNGSGSPAKRYWCFPDDPSGSRGMLDLSNLNRTPLNRGAMFRALGGLHKDGKNRKTLVPGSPEVGSPFTLAMLEEGLRLADKHYGAEPEFLNPDGSVKAFSIRPTNIPMDRQDLRQSADVVEGWWRKGQGHPLRLALAGTLLRSELVSLSGAEQVLLATTASGVDENGQPFDTRSDARATVVATAQRLGNRYLRTAGPRSLRDLVGSPALFDLAWAMSRDLGKPLAHVWDRLTSSRKNEASEVKGVVDDIAKVMLEFDSDDSFTPDERKEKRKRASLSRHRLMSSAICGKRRNDTKCSCCDGIRCKKHMECNDPSCPRCLRSRIRDLLELLTLPKFCKVVHRSGFPTKKAAEKAYSRLPRYGKKRPRALYGITPDGSWECTLIADRTDSGACTTASALVTADGGSVHDWQAPHQVRDWVARVLILKHVTARQAVEKGDRASLKLMLDAYRTHITSGSDRSIPWPTKAQIRELRKARAEKRPKTPEELAEECKCPEEVKKVSPPYHEIVNVDTNEVVVGDLERPPTLAQVAAHEAGERVKLNRNRRFRFARRE